MSQKSSLPQVTRFVSEALMPDTAVHLCGKGNVMTLAEGAAAITELGLLTTA